MVFILKRKTKSDLTKQEWQDIQQPLDYKSGWSNPEFDKNYSRDNNPYKDTERDIKNKKVKVFLGKD